MSKGKFEKSCGGKIFGNKSVALILALVLVLGAVIGGTIAWLTDSTDPVINTFTTSDIDITLAESENLNLKMIPGHTITKDPKATVLATSEDCYLFVEITKNATYDNYFENYVVADGWTALGAAYPGVYYMDIDTAEEKGVAYPVLKDNKVTVKSTVTKTMMEDIDDSKVVAPTLTFTAYAIQRNNSNTTQFGAENAWKEIKGLSGTP